MPSTSSHENDGQDPVHAEAKLGKLEALDTLLRRANAGDGDALTTLVVLGLQHGQAAARDRLMEFVGQHLVKVARRVRRGHEDDPESMAQAGVIDLLKRPIALQHYTAGTFVAYLNRMARNWAYDQEQKRWLRNQTSLGGESDGHHKPPPAVADALPITIAADRLETLLSRIPDEEHRFVVRKRVEGLSYEEIGQLLTPPRAADAVRMQFNRAVTRLGKDPRVQRELEP